MGALENLINAGIDDLTGNSRGTTLQDFLTKFSPKDGKWVTMLDPLNTFDVSMKFHPPIEGQADKGSSFLNAAIQMVNNAANNITGGLASSVLDEINGSSNSIQNARNSAKAGEESIMTYLTKGNLLTDSDNLIGTSLAQQSGGGSTVPTEIQLGYYVQNITVPMLKVADGGKSETLVGNFPLVGNYVGPDNNQLQMSILNTKVPLFERLFYPWMRETTLPFWSYDMQPYTTATITIDFSKHADIKYVFYGCRPQQIGTIQPTQEPATEITRDITFIFDFMFIQSENNVKESLMNNLVNAGKQLLGAGTSMFDM